MYGIVVEALIWLAALARAAFELLRREIREGIEALDYPDPNRVFGDPGYPHEREQAAVPGMVGLLPWGPGRVGGRQPNGHSP